MKVALFLNVGNTFLLSIVVVSIGFAVESIETASDDCAVSVVLVSSNSDTVLVLVLIEKVDVLAGLRVIYLLMGKDVGLGVF